MTRTLCAALVAFLSLSACAAGPDSFIAERAENDVLRFSYGSLTGGPR